MTDHAEIEVGGVDTAPPTSAERDSAPPATLLLAVTCLVLCAITVIAGWYVCSVAAEQMAEGSAWRYALIGAAAAMPLLLLPGIGAVRASRGATRLNAAGDVVAARASAERARNRAISALGLAGATLQILGAVMALTANDGAVMTTFFSWEEVQTTFGGIAKALWINVVIAVTSMAIVLVVALFIAIGRLLPGRPLRPIRALAVAWVDIFRAIPCLVLIYLIGFGLPLTGIPVISSLPPIGYAILALSLTYSAYVAETYRAGIESVHPSQVAAGRSLGLGATTTLRLVVLPQAVRRVVPALLSLFIGLQKDTALVGVVGLIDAFAQARIYAANEFNLTPVTVVCGLFIVLTIPQTRLSDTLLARADRRRGR